MRDSIYSEWIALLPIVQKNQHRRFYSDCSKQMIDGLHPEWIALLPIVQKNQHCWFYSDYSK